MITPATLNSGTQVYTSTYSATGTYTVTLIVSNDLSGSTLTGSCSDTLTICEDKDGDGVSTCDGDCDDNNPDIYSGNTEVCDMFDNDCDTEVNEDNNCCTLTGVIDINFGNVAVSDQVQELRVAYENPNYI